MIKIILNEARYFFLSLMGCKKYDAAKDSITGLSKKLDEIVNETEENEIEEYGTMTFTSGAGISINSSTPGSSITISKQNKPYVITLGPSVLDSNGDFKFIILRSGSGASDFGYNVEDDSDIASGIILSKKKLIIDSASINYKSGSNKQEIFIVGPGFTLDNANKPSGWPAGVNYWKAPTGAYESKKITISGSL